MNQVGLDLGTNSIKAVEVKLDRGKSSLVNIAKARSGKLAFLSDSVREKSDSVQYLTDFVVQNNLLGKPANISLPESLIYTRVLNLPRLNSKELSKAVQLEIEQESPIPLSEASMTFQILPDAKPNNDKMEVLAVIAPKSLTKKVHELVTNSGLKVTSIEPETIATGRSLISDFSESPVTLIADIGHTSSVLSIFMQNSIRLTRPFPTAFTAIVKSVAQSLDLEMVQAEEYVKTYGLVSDKLNGKIKDSVSPIYSIILNEIKRAMTYFETRGYGENVKRVLLCGGGSLIPGVVVYTANYLGVEVELADPWSQFSDLGKYRERGKELEDIAPLFATAVGSSLKPLS